MYDVSGLGPSRKEEGRGMILKTSYFVLAKGDTSKFKIQNYEKGNMEADCADSDFDSDCTGDDAGSDVVYVATQGGCPPVSLFIPRSMT